VFVSTVMVDPSGENSWSKLLTFIWLGFTPNLREPRAKFWFLYQIDVTDPR